MKKAEISFQFVTPCITAGADQKEAEFRIPSIRGELRWWYRALGYEENCVPETDIFGGQIGKEMKASSLVIRETSQSLPWDLKDCTGIVGNKFDYFLWPMGKPENSRGVIPAGTSGKISVSLRKTPDARKLEGIEYLEEIFKGFFLLGSLGTRSRRCYGSLWPTKIEIDGEEWAIPSDLDSFQEEIGRQAFWANMKISTLSKAQKDWKAAVNVCSNFLKKYRCGKTDPRFHQTASQWGKNDHDAGFGSKIDTLYRPAIGLPYETKYYKLKNAPERFASPLHFKIIKLDDGYYPLAIYFRDHFLKTPSVKVGGKSLEISNELLEEMMNDSHEGEVLFDV